MTIENNTTSNLWQQFYAVGVAHQASHQQGYIQIYLSHDGHFSVRGTSGFVEWLLAELVASGWRMTMDDIRWCG